MFSTISLVRLKLTYVIIAFHLEMEGYYFVPRTGYRSSRINQVTSELSDN